MTDSRRARRAPPPISTSYRTCDWSKQRSRDRPHFDRSETQWLQRAFELLAVADGDQDHAARIEIASRERSQRRCSDRVELQWQSAVVVDWQGVSEQVGKRARRCFVGLEQSGQRLRERAAGALQLVRGNR